jgi:hypothetical protein
VLTVVRYYRPRVSIREVLKAVRPSPEWGCGQKRVIDSLRAFGVRAGYRDDLNLAILHQLIGEGRPVIVTVEPGDWVCDHWCVVRGVDRERKRIHLVNGANTTRSGGMSWIDFRKEWSPVGGGLVCESG